MAITTENTYLITKNASTWSKVVDIKEFPDLGGDPSSVDTTTLSNHMKVGLPGLVDPGVLTFKANYTKADYATVKAMEGSEKDFGVQFGKTGADGVHTFKGTLTVYVNGGGVEEAVDMTISIVASTEIEETSATNKATIS